MKKFLGFAFVICVVVSLITIVPVSAATYGDYTYEINDGNVTITGFNSRVSREIVIPDTIEG